MSKSLASLNADISALAAKAAASTVTVGRNGRGSGIVIGPNEVLTNAHNLRDRTTQITLSDGTAHQGTLVATDPHGDLAIIAADTGDTTPLVPADATPALGSLVVTASGGHGNARVGLGHVSSVNRRFRGPGGRAVTGAFEHFATLPKGASGGPVLDTEGRLIGINTHRSSPASYLARPFDATLLGRIEALRSGRSFMPRRLGVALHPNHVAARLRAAVGLPERAGALVRLVEAGGPADRAGIAEGDLIIAIGDGDAAVPVDGADSLHAALDAIGFVSEVAVRIVRGADESDVVVSFLDTDSSDDSVVGDASNGVANTGAAAGSESGKSAE